MNRSLLALLLLATFPWNALAQSPSIDDGDGLLAFVNDQSWVTQEVLDTDCAIRSDSAKHILRARDGRDRTPYTADDDLFDSLAELGDVAMVGEWTLLQLEACATDFGYILATCDVASEVVETWRWDDLPAEAQELVEPALGYTYACDDGAWMPLPVPRFGDATLSYEDCELTDIVVREVQLFDPDYGIYYLITHSWTRADDGSWIYLDYYCLV